MSTEQNFSRNYCKSILDLDTNICLRVNKLAGKKVIDKSLYIISKLGDGYIYFSSLAIIILFYNKPFLMTYKDYVLAAIMNFLIYRVVKKRVKRKRPFTAIQSVSMLISPPDEFSFPSGHSSAAAVFCLCTYYHFPSIVFAVTFIWLLLVGFSRVYNGVHYPGDVIVGYIMGILAGKATLSLIQFAPSLIDRI